MSAQNHISVLLEEVLGALHVKKTRKYIDATLGAGGHSAAILARGGKVLGIEMDREMIEVARARLQKTGGDFEIVQGNFAKIDKLAMACHFSQVEGVIYDLGISSLHYENGRGFSFENENEPLDMRLDVVIQAVTAADLTNSLRLDQLEEMFVQTMDLREARHTARLIFNFRERQKCVTVGDLLKALSSLPRGGKLHPATKVFAALRIAVNSELTNLRESLPAAFGLLKPGGRLVVISFHSGEDEIVKQQFREWEAEGKGVALTKKPTVRTEAETERNPRARSAKMRVLERK